MRNALVLTEGQNDYMYLLPWLYAASAFINLNLERYGFALRSALHLARLPQVSPLHKFMAVLFKVTAFFCLTFLTFWSFMF